MKNLIVIIFVSIITFFSACDVVEEPYTTTNGGGGPGDEVIQKVLLEDYTGHDCVNCPTAAVEAHDLKEIFGDQLIVMAVHAGWFARPIPAEPSLDIYFGNDASEEWNTFFQVVGNPTGMVNRVPSSPGNYLVEWGNWGSAINALVENEPEAKMTIENVFNENTKKLETTVTTQFITAQTHSLNLLVCITQDSIISGQRNNDENVGETPLIEEYVFMHMLRGSLNGNWGENISDGEPIEVGTDYEKTYTVNFPDDWIPKDCHVVAFVYHEVEKTILQVEEAHVLE